MRIRHAGIAPLAAVGALACAGCGSAADINIIREWSHALSAGDLDKAASYFALPAIIENGTPPVRVTSRAQAREFNQLLPCGAQLIATARHGAYIYAKFRLTNRLGGDCGTGTGATAATLFLIRNGKIAEWLRVPNPGGSQQQPPSGPTPARGAGQAV